MLRPQGPEKPTKPDFLKGTLEEVFKQTFTTRNGLVPYNTNWSIQRKAKENL